eukprot:941490-Rhodomonas_salina.1
MAGCFGTMAGSRGELELEGYLGSDDDFVAQVLHRPTVPPYACPLLTYAVRFCTRLGAPAACRALETRCTRARPLWTRSVVLMPLSATRVLRPGSTSCYACWLYWRRELLRLSACSLGGYVLRERGTEG